MEVILVSDDVVFPTNSGGRLEVLGECAGLSALGINVNLIVSHRLEFSQAAREEHAALAWKVNFLRRHNFLLTTLTHPLLPYQMASRGHLSNSTIDSLRTESTIGVIASHEWTVPLARDIARRLKLPLLLRSHNDECSYMRLLANNAKGLRRVYFELERLRLKFVLRSIYKSVNFVAVLSESDRESYERFKVPTFYIPPVLSLAESTEKPRLRDSTAAETILFVGALDMPQTAAGLRWFCDDVLPMIQAAVPRAELHVAGRRSSARLSHYLESSAGVVFHGEVEVLDDLYEQARVFINPVFEGSGVNMKMGPPAELGIPIVTTRTGLRGLELLSPGLLVADDASSFAEACVRLMSDDDLWEEKSQKATELVGRFAAPSIAGHLVTLFENFGSVSPQSQ